MSRGKTRQRGRGQTDTRGWPGVGGFSASLSEEMSSASPNRSSAAADAFAVKQHEIVTTRTNISYSRLN